MLKETVVKGTNTINFVVSYVYKEGKIVELNLGVHF